LWHGPSPDPDPDTSGDNHCPFTLLLLPLLMANALSHRNGFLFTLMAAAAEEE
jgi:hypothetical protein